MLKASFQNAIYLKFLKIDFFIGRSYLLYCLSMTLAVAEEKDTIQCT